MNRDPRRLADYLAHILEAVERIDGYTQDMDKAAFLASRLVQDAVIRNIEVIGEAGNNIQKRCPEFAAAHPELPLAVAYQMRNVVADGYFSVDYDVVWNTIRHELPALYKLVQSAVEDAQRGMDGP